MGATSLRITAASHATDDEPWRPRGSKGLDDRLIPVQHFDLRQVRPDKPLTESRLMTGDLAPHGPQSGDQPRHSRLLELEPSLALLEVSGGLKVGVASSVR